MLNDHSLNNKNIIDFQNETIKLINDTVNKTINEKIEFLVSNFDDMSNNLVESINGNSNLGKLIQSIIYILSKEESCQLM